MKKNKPKSRMRNRIMAGMMTMLLCMTSFLPVWAGVGGTHAAPQKAEFKKTLQHANVPGLTVPKVTFDFTFTAVQKDNDTSNAASMPAIPAAKIAFEGGTGTPDSTTGMLEVTKTSGNVLADLNWATLGTGVYEYEVKETADGFNGAAGEKINYSQSKYKLYAVIAYDSNTKSYYVEQTSTNQTVNNTGGTGDGKGGANQNDNDHNFLFRNTYTKQGGTTPGTDALKITAASTGTVSDKSKQFNYTLKANDSVTGVAPATYTGTITRAGEDRKTSTVSLKADGSESLSFALASGDKIVFNTLPVGTTFTVEETGTASYLTAYNGRTTDPISGTGKAGENLSTGKQTIGTTNNEVNFTNTYDNSLIPTGILSNIAPFGALIAAAVVGFVAFAAATRRKARR